MRLTTKLSALVTLPTGLTIFTTLLGYSLSFYNAIQYKFSHRVQAVATAIDTYLMSNDFSMLRPRVTELMMPVDIVRVDLLHGDKQVYTLVRNGSYCPVGINDLFRELSVPLVKHLGTSLHLIYQDPMGNYFHSLMTTTPLMGAIGFITLMLFLAVRWSQWQLVGQELLETQVIRTLNGERGSSVSGTIYEWSPRTSSALDMLLCEIQNAHEQHGRLDTLTHSHTAQDMKIGPNNQPFFDNQLVASLEDQEKAGIHGIVMMARLPDFNMLSDTWGHSQVEEQLFFLTNLLSIFMMHYSDALPVCHHRSGFAALLPHRTLKEAESIASQLTKVVDTLSNNKMLDRDDMIHIGICAWRSGQDTGQVMEHAEFAARNARLQGSDSWAIHDDSLPEKGCGSVRWRTLIEQMLSRGGPRLYQKPAVTREGRVHYRELMCRIFNGNEEVSSAEYMPMVLQSGLSEEYDRPLISRLIPLLRYWPEENLAVQIIVESLIRPCFQRWLRDTLMQCEKSQWRHIIIELAEADVGQHISRSQSATRLANALGVWVVVSQAGLTLVSISWIKELNVELLKLHPGLIRNTEKRTENQLLVQSLMGAYSGISAQVHATDARSWSEWQVLIRCDVTGG